MRFGSLAMRIEKLFTKQEQDMVLGMRKLINASKIDAQALDMVRSCTPEGTDAEIAILRQQHEKKLLEILARQQSNPAAHYDRSKVAICNPVFSEGKSCRNCNSRDVKLHQCSRCKGVYYCSVACQKSDWKRHKPDCKEFVDKIDFKLPDGLFKTNVSSSSGASTEEPRRNKGARGK